MYQRPALIICLKLRDCLGFQFIVALYHPKETDANSQNIQPKKERECYANSNNTVKRNTARCKYKAYSGE